MDPTEKQVSTSLKYWLTATACFTYIGFGLGSSILGVTMLDMKDLLDASMADMGYGLTIQVTATCCASIIVSWLFTKFNRQIGIFLSTLLLAVGLICIPIFATKVSFLLSQAVIGIAYAGLNNAPNALIAEIWEEKCNPYIQTMHFSFAIGAVIGPLISEPFLASRTSLDSAMTTNETVIDLANITTTSTKSLVYIPYAITSATILLSALSVIILSIILPYKNADRKIEAKNTLVNELEESDCHDEPLMPQNDSKYYAMLIIVIGGLLINCDYGLEQNFFQYMQVYSVLGPLKLTESTGAYLISASSAAFAAGRFFGIILATKISARSMLYVDGVIMITGSFIILLWNTELGLWIGYIVLGFGCSSVFPTILAYAEERINVTTYVAGTFVFFGSMAGLVVPYYEGRYVEAYPVIFSYLNIACTIPFLLLCFVLHLIDLTRPRAQVEV